MAKSRKVIQAHAHVEQHPDVRGGVPILAGTGTRVMDVAVRYEVMGMSPEEILVVLPHLTLPHVHTALAYYYGHKAELDKKWKAALRRMNQLRKSHPSKLERVLAPVKDLRG